METYHGHVRTPADAIILFEACRIGLLPRVQRRLSEKERQSIKSGSVFVWDEREAGMRRWTDGKSWSASRVSGSFLCYREMEGKRGGSSFDKGNRDGMTGQDGDSDGGPDGYRYKPDGLMKQSFSITTNQGQHLHLISYYSRSTTANNLMQPTNDPQLRHIRPEKGMYPDSTVHEQSSIPAVTRGPMGSPGYAQAPPQPPYNRAPHYYNPWGAPPSPMHTPPPHHAYAPSPYYQHPHHAPYPHMYGPHPAYPPPPGMTAFDRPPPPMSNNGLPPPPHSQYGPPPHYQGNYPPPPQTYHSGYPYQPPPLQAPPYPTASHQQPPYEHPKPQDQQPQPEARTDDRQDSQQQTSSPTSKQDSQATAGAQDPAQAPSAPASVPTPAPVPAAVAPPAASSGQTIPSISAMLNAGENGQPPPRTSSRSPPGAGPRTGIDIPSHKLGFEASRDVQALRNLDKTTFKQY